MKEGFLIEFYGRPGGGELTFGPPGLKNQKPSENGMDTFGISLDKKIRQAIRQGNGTCTSIASHADARLEDVYRELQRMICDGEIQKGKSGALTIYEFAAKGNPLNTPETKEKILNAIRAGFKSLPGIKRHAGFERSDDLTDALEDLQHDSVIKKFTNPELSAYFECPEKPRCFWQETDGTVGAELENLDEPDEDPEEEEETEVEELKSPKPAKPALAQKPKYRPKKIGIDLEKLRELAEQGLSQVKIAEALGLKSATFATRLGREPELRKILEEAAKAGGHEKFDWSPKTIEKIAAEVGEVEAAAKVIGVSISAVYMRLKRFPELRAAWDRGLAKFTRPETPKKEKTKKMKSSAKTAPETTGEHQLAFNDHAAGDYAGSTPEPEPLEIPPPPPAEPSNQVEKMPTVPEDFAKCENCGLYYVINPADPGCELCLLNLPSLPVGLPISGSFDDSEPVVDPRFEHTIDHLSEKSEASRNGFEAKRQELAHVASNGHRNTSNGYDRASADVAVAASHRTVNLETGAAQILIGFTGNVFDMSRRDRDYLNRFIDLAQEYREEK